MDAITKTNQVKLTVAFVFIILFHLLIIKSSAGAMDYDNEKLKTEKKINEIHSDDSLKNKYGNILNDKNIRKLSMEMDSLASAITENLRITEDGNKLIIKWKDHEQILDLSRIDSLRIELDNIELPAIPEIPDMPNPPDLINLDSALQKLDFKLKFDEKQVQQKIDSAMKILEKKLKELEDKMEEMEKEQ